MSYGFSQITESSNVRENKTLSACKLYFEFVLELYNTLEQIFPLRMLQKANKNLHKVLELYQFSLT